MSYALLTNQTKWCRIVPHLREVDELFFHYDPEKIKQYPGSYFSEGVFKLKCGAAKNSMSFATIAIGQNIQILNVEFVYSVD